VRFLAALAFALLLAASAHPAGAEEARPLVTAVEFFPAGRLGPYRFAEMVAVHPGEEHTPERVERSVRLLRQTGLFEQVQAETIPDPPGLRVVFQVRPYPLVDEVRIKGNFLLLERDLRPVLRLRPVEPFVEATVRADVERLRRHYDDEGFSGTEVTEEVDRRPDAVSVTYHVKEGKPEVVREVVIRGSSGIEAGEVSAKLGLTRFTFYRGVNLQRGVERVKDFYQSRGYLDVKVVPRVETGEGIIPPITILFNPIKGLLTLRPGDYRVVTVTLEVTEGRRYEVVFHGVPSSAEEDLRGLLTFPRTGFFDPEEVEASRARILEYYQQRGHYLAEVDVQADYEAGRVDFTVRAGRTVPVARVLFRGVTVKEGELRSRLATQQTINPETPRPLIGPDLEEDRRRITAWYRDEGYDEAEALAPEVWPDATPEGAQVTFPVREGVRTLVRYVSFEGAAALPADRLRGIVGIAEGSPYRAAAVARAVEQLTLAYRRGGYPVAAVQARTDFTAGREAVDLRFFIREGAPQRLGVVAVTGNGATRREIILREVPLRTGDLFNPEALAQGRNNLYELGIFREVRFLFPEVVAPGAPQDVVLQVRERSTGSLSFGAGYASDEEYRGFVEIGEQSLFGTGRGVRWKGKLSMIGYRTDLFYQEPWLLNFKLKGEADLYLERRDEIGYEVLRRGLTLGVNKELSKRLVGNLRYRYEFVNYRDVQPDLVEEEGPLDPVNITSVIAVLDYDRRDNPIVPRRGSHHLASLELASPALGGDTSFTKYQAETAWFLPLGGAAELALAFRGGFTRLLRRSGDLPLSERFFLGGDRTVRGYGFKELGPQDDSGDPLGGNAFVLGNLELRFTIWRKLRGVAFLDAGELWSESHDPSSTGMKTAVGPGLRYDTLVGPLRFDYGYKLRPEAGESPGQWHLTIGYPF
jgi:outer membrane protein insertion porin family